MNSKIFIVLILSSILQVMPKEIKDSEDVKKADSRTVYDQRQTGKYNVHVNIKDVHFFNIKDAISSLGDYGSYDYEGDYESGEGIDGDYDIAHLTVSFLAYILQHNFFHKKLLKNLVSKLKKIFIFLFLGKSNNRFSGIKAHQADNNDSTINNGKIRIN